MPRPFMVAMRLSVFSALSQLKTLAHLVRRRGRG